MTADNPGRFPATPSHVRRATLTLLLGSFGCLLLLHVLRRDLNPVERRLSEYASGRYSSLMLITFLAMGLGLLLLGRQLSSSAGRSRFAAGLIGLAGIGLLVSGAFPTGSGSPVIEILHSRASGSAVLALTLAAALAATDRAEPERRPLAVRSLTAVAVVAVLVSPLLHDTRWSGLGQRMAWVSLGAWLILTAWHLPADKGTTAGTQEVPRQ